MACKGKVLVAVVVVFLGLIAEQQMTFVNGDPALILQVCLGTHNATACGECLYSHPGVTNEHINGLARLSIDCASSASKKALDLASYMAAEHEQGLPPFDTCIPKLRDGDVQITNAFKSLQEGRYNEAANQVLDGTQTARECSDNLMNYRRTEDIVNHIAILQRYRDAAAGVLYQIH